MSKYIIPNNFNLNEDHFDIVMKVKNFHKAFTEIYAVMNDIRCDDSWVNDSHSQAKYDGGVDAIERIIKKLNYINNQVQKERDNKEYL